MNRPNMLKMATVALLGTALFASAAPAQTAKDLIGAWTLVSDENVRADGSRVQVMGPNPQGLLIFDADGRYSLQLLRPGRPKFGSNNRMEGTPEENKAAVQGANPHWGTYSVNEANKTIDFKIEHAFFPELGGNGTEAAVHDHRRPTAVHRHGVYGRDSRACFETGQLHLPTAAFGAMPPNLSLSPDASPAALTRRPLGAG